MTAALHDQALGARTITYKTTPVVCRVICGRRRDRDRKDNTVSRVCWIRVAKADVPAPAYQDQVTIGAETWLMAEVDKETHWD